MPFLSAARRRGNAVLMPSISFALQRLLRNGSMLDASMSPDGSLHFEKIGVDSCDGSGIARYTHMREAISRRQEQQEFFA